MLVSDMTLLRSLNSKSGSEFCILPLPPPIHILVCTPFHIWIVIIAWGIEELAPEVAAGICL